MSKTLLLPATSSSALLVVVVMLLLACGAQATKWQACDKNKTQSEVSNVVVSQCETLDETCPFNRGFNKSIELEFTPTKRFDVVKVRITGKLNHLPVPFHVKPDEACGNYGFECPLEPSKSYKFKMSLPVLRTYPKVNVDVFLRLVDESDSTITCVEIPARIQEPPKE